MRTLLILGTPRSGTSWLAKAFDSHPWVTYRNEPDEILPASRLPRRINRNAIEAAEYIAQLLETRTTKTVGGFPVFRKGYRSAAAHWLRLLWITALRVPEVTHSGRRTVRRIQIPELSDNHIESKMLGVIKSVSLVDRAGLFAHAVPELRIILIVRHPCSSVASVLRGLRASKFVDEAFGYDIVEMEQARRRGLTKEQLRSAPVYEQLAWRWTVYNEKAIDELADCPNALVMTYEDMIKDAEAAIKKAFAFADLPWDRQTAEFVYESQHSRGPHRYYGVYRGSDFSRNAGNWTDVLSPNEADRILSIAQDSSAGRLFA